MKDISFLKENLIAHRGMHNNKIEENTIKAFQKAIDNNYLIELDVHLTKDKKIVVFHDNDLKRLCNIDKELKNCTLKELNNIKLTKTKDNIPTLKEVLELVNDKVPLIIEIKMDTDKEIIDYLIEILDKYNGRFAVMSFSQGIMEEIAKKRNNYIKGLLIGRTGKNIIDKFKNIRKIKKLKLDFLSVSINVANGRFIKFFRIPIIIWTIIRDEEYQKYKNKAYNLTCENINSFKL